MSAEMEQRYAERLKRYVTAMRNEKPDRVPIRPFVAEFTAKYAGYTCQEVTHDYEKAFAAARKCAADFDWDAVVGNMVYVWTGLTQAIGLKYYGSPASTSRPTRASSTCEPPEDEAFMRADEYDAADRGPDRLPVQRLAAARLGRRRAARASRPRTATTCRSSRAAWRCCSYFTPSARRSQRLRNESGTVSAIAGILKAPLDILADKLRGYLGLFMDLFDQPDKVLAACEALMPHLLHVALTGADPEQERAHRALDAPRLRAVRLADAVRDDSTGPRSSRSSRSSGPAATRRCSMPRATGTRT